MRVTHTHPYDSVTKRVPKNVGVFLANNGDYYAGFSERQSKYQGWYVRKQKDSVKILDAITVHTDKRPTAIHNHFSYIERTYDSFSETIHLPAKDVLHYTSSEEVLIELVFDVRPAYADPVFGREHIHSNENDMHIIKYHYKEEAPLFIAIRSDANTYNILNTWAEYEYPLDNKRRSYPRKKHLYRGVEFFGTRFSIAVENTREEAIAKAHDTFDAMPQQIDRTSDMHSPIPTRITNPEIGMAYYASSQALQDLLIDDGNTHVGLYAGLPWFFQFWARDELISLTGLQPKTQTRILERYVRDIQCVSSLASSDALGWLFFRVYENAHKKNMFSLPLFLLDPYAHNGVSITWMDSLPDRNGRRIETLALALAMYRDAYKTTKDGHYKAKETELKKYVRNALWNGTYLEDGVNDKTIRPNIFIAAYAYPELLSKKEWEACIDTALKALWLPWGGVTTIDKTDPRFIPTHTGEDPTSYHNGDSWFFVNNIAAIVMHRINPQKYRSYIYTVTAASTSEILWHGMVGKPTEVSSAEALRSEGCWVQAWSAATYIELIRETS
jgi:glycogen debranching enzyme